ncbi:calphotin-like [Centruroides sculpturatus]|uniref:calphotin-like n=1 Tax=Centruroides sculpturatus TaxID=218467 RepID=UPI000C6EF7E5|nr:calphotin-like [Centruroides sculpturatus]
MKIFVIFITLLSTSFGTYPGYVSTPVQVHPANIESHAFAAEVRHNVPVAAPPVLIHAPKSIHTVEDVISPAVVNPATFAVDAPKSFHTVVAPNAPVSVPVAAAPVNPHIVKSFSHATQIQHNAPIPVEVAPKSIHAVNTHAAIPAAVPFIDTAVPKSIHAPISPVETPVVKSFSYATEIQHDAPVVAVRPVSISAAPKSIHAVRHFSTAPAVAPVVDIRVPTSIHAPVEVPTIKSFSYATEIQHDAPVSVPVAVGAAPKSIHAVTPIATAPAAAPIVNIRVPTSIHAPYGLSDLNAFSYGSQIHHTDPVSVPVAPKSIHAIQSLAAAPAVAPVVPTIHAAAEIPAVKSFSYAGEIQHNAPASVPVSVGAAPKSIHAFSDPSIAPVVDITAPAPLLKSFSYGTGVQHNAAVNIQAPIAPIAAAPKSIHHTALSPAPIHPVRAIHATNINTHPLSSVVAPAVPLSAAKSYTTEIRRRIPLSTGINYSPAPIVVTSPVGLHSPVANNLAYGHVLPVTTNGVNIHLNRDMYARIAAPGAYLWNGQALQNGVGYVSGIAGPLAYRPVPVYYRNFVKPTNAIYHYLRGK